MQTQATTLQPPTSIYKDASVTIGTLGSRADLLHVGAAEPRKGSTCNISDTASGLAEHTSPPNRSALAAGRESLNTGAGCSNPAGVLYNVLTAQLYIAGCRKWKCEPCGKRRAKELFHRLVGYRFQRLITLTAPPSTRPTREAVQKLNYAWKLLHQWLLRRPELDGKRFDYVWGNEAGGEHGQLHKHIALPWFWFSYKAMTSFIWEVLAKRGLCGKVRDYGKRRAIKHKRAVGYVLDYVIKDRSEFPHYSRRVQTSVRRQVEKQAGWCFLPSWSPQDVHPEWMLDATTAEAIGIARQYLAEYLSELALMSEEKQHAAFLERADAGLEGVK